MYSFPATDLIRDPLPSRITRLTSGGSVNNPNPPPAKYLSAFPSSSPCCIPTVVLIIASFGAIQCSVVGSIEFGDRLLNSLISVLSPCGLNPRNRELSSLSPNLHLDYNEATLGENKHVAHSQRSLTERSGYDCAMDDIPNLRAVSARPNGRSRGR